LQEAFACVGPIGHQRQHGRSHDCSCRHDREDQAQVVCQGVCHPRFPDAALLQEGRQEKCGSQPVSPPVSAGPHRPSPGRWLALSCPLPPSTDRDSAGSAPVFAVYRYAGPRTYEALLAFAKEGWKTAEEYDPSKQPPPKPRKSVTETLHEVFTANWKLATGFAVVMVSTILFAVISGCRAGADDDDDPPDMSSGFKRPLPASAARSEKQD
jgi:hypothetical protein